MRKWLLYFMIGCMLYVPCAHAKVDASKLVQKTQQASHTNTPGLDRFKYMRFYTVRNTLPQEPGLFAELFSSPEKQAHIHALAIYFLNMQISMKSYGQTQAPRQLTLNYLGVLDGLVGGLKPFDTSKATDFYKKNKADVDAYLAQIRQNSIASTWPAPSQAQLNAWLTLLEKQPRRSGKTAYLFPANNLLQAPVPTQAAQPFRTALAILAQKGKQQIITYEKSEVQLEDFDNKFTSHAQHVKRTYRWVKDECHYSTYLLGRLLADEIAQKKINGNTRLYVLTALPKSGEFLRPASGTRFTLANGSTGLHWRYHTALLVVWPHGNGHVPMVLDSFLGGQEPVSLDDWLTHFHADTVFAAVPFLRNKKTEEAIKVPQKIQGTSVWVQGVEYTPHPVEN